MSKDKTRLDLLVLELGLAESRNVAQSLIIRGLILVNEVPVTKPGALIDNTLILRLKDSGSRYVSRGGEKLEHALDYFKIVVLDKVAIDIGASTGGFTHCLLERGAKTVYAVDVGQNQLSYKIRTDPRVFVFEQTHASSLTREMFPEPASLCVMDVSFISVRKVLEKVLSTLEPVSQLVILVKPQFELEREYVGAGGVVKSEKHQLLAVELVEDFAKDLGLKSSGYVKSPILGAKKGNQEYLLSLRKE